MPAKLYALTQSHPAHAARRMLEDKGIEHEVVYLLPGFHPVQLRFARFRGGTVPALLIDGRRVQGSLKISRALDQIQPDPPLFPTDPEARARVEEAEAWGERELQPIPRRLYRWALIDNAQERARLAEVSGIPAPGLAAALGKPQAIAFARMSGADEAAVRSDLLRLPGLLDRVDALLEAGTLGGERLNAADYQIGAGVRSLLSFADLRGAVEGRPAAALAERVLPDFPGEVPPLLPPSWIEPLHVTVAA